MNRNLVDRLIRLQYQRTDNMHKKARASFEIHINPAFGWCIASTYAQARVPFPRPVTGRDRWLFNAYLASLNPVAHADMDVEEARQICLNPAVSAKLKALLITGLGKPIDAHLNLVSDKTGIPRRAVEAFEILFFNVLDRHGDHTYLSNIVYPEGRVVELAEDYIETTSIGDLLLRAAYNHRDIDLVLRLAGMTDAARKKELRALHESMCAELKARITGHALFIAKVGMINERSVGLQRAVTLLAAKPPQEAADAATQPPHDTSAELAAALAAIPPHYRRRPSGNARGVPPRHAGFQ